MFRGIVRWENVWIPTQDDKSLRAAVVVCDILVNTKVHTQTDTQTDGF